MFRYQSGAYSFLMKSKFNEVRQAQADAIVIPRIAYIFSLMQNLLIINKSYFF